MAKRPVAGAVKNRLARKLGPGAAVRFHRTTLAHTLLRLGADPRWRTYLAVTPDTSVTESCWPLHPLFPRLPQGHGDLGARMQNLFDAMPPGPVIIVGSDIPAIRASHIAHAFRLLGRADAVFGPAQDGGYWLVGLRRRPRRVAPFNGVPWSTSRTLDATRANLRRENVVFSSTLSDVDTADDYLEQRCDAERLVRVRRASHTGEPRRA